MAVRLLDKGMSKNAAAKRMGLSWNGFNSLVNPTMRSAETSTSRTRIF